MITDLIKFKVKPKCIDQAIALLKEQIINTRNEEGCIEDNLFQLKNNPTVIYLLIKWRDEEALKKHMVQPYELKFKKEMDKTLEGPVEPVKWRQII